MTLRANTKANDLEILWVDPGTPDPNLTVNVTSEADKRVPSAAELRAANHLHQQNLARAQRLERPSGLRNRPQFGVAGKGVVIPAGVLPYSPGHPALGALPQTTVTLPALADTTSNLSRYDSLYLMAFGVVVTAAIDADINLSFEWQSQSKTLQTLTKENTRRVRTVWAVVCTQSPTSSSAIYAALPTVLTGKGVTISSKATAGVNIGGFQFYWLDPELKEGKTYTILEDTIDLIDLCRVWRVQNFNQSGYLWGRGGEKSFEAGSHIQATYRYVGDGWEDWSSRARDTLYRLFAGRAVANSPTLDRSVQNLINGQNNANQDAPGLATASPNGSTALANGQRVSFTNQAITQKTYCLPVATINAGGFSQASVPFQTNSPNGSFFSQNKADHRVWSANGVDITLDGSLTGLGGTGALTWTASSTAVTPGDVVYIAPAIFYPAGSGFPVTGEIEQVYLNGQAINAANVRQAAINDLDAYTAPAVGESYFAVLGKERAALHYLYRRVTIASSSSGVVAIPSDAAGLIAFISGPNAPTGRQDKPVIAGLSPSTNYNVLLYHPPKPTDTWQFQFQVARYAGSGESDWLSGAAIATHPIVVAHSHGGGNSVFASEGEIQYEPIAFRLPANTSNKAVKSYQCNYKIEFVGEPAGDDESFREIPLRSSRGLASPHVGTVLTVANNNEAQTKGIAAKLLNSSGQSLGVLKLPIQCSQIYQLVITFLAVKEGERRLVIVTCNSGNPAKPAGCAFDSNSPNFAAIDTFHLY
jgi:hypothetical protein